MNEYTVALASSGGPAFKAVYKILQSRQPSIKASKLANSAIAIGSANFFSLTEAKYTAAT